jgi:hypothetical protein
VPKHGISDATFYTWRTKYGGMEVSDARKERKDWERLRPLVRRKMAYAQAADDFQAIRVRMEELRRARQHTAVTQIKRNRRASDSSQQRSDHHQLSFVENQIGYR